MVSIWKRSWNRYTFSIFNFIIVWSIPPLTGELIGRLFGIKFLGMIAGFIYSFAKTQYDYIKTKI